MLIRRATAADAAGLAALRRAWVEEQGTVEPGADPAFEERFAAWLADAGAGRIVWAAEDAGGTLVAMMNLAVFERMPSPGRPAGRWGYLSNAFVLPGYRDAGLGRAVLARVMAYAEENGLVRVVLSPSERAVTFYRRAGFGPADMLMARRLP